MTHRPVPEYKSYSDLQTTLETKTAQEIELVLELKIFMAGTILYYEVSGFPQQWFMGELYCQNPDIRVFTTLFS